MRNPWPKIRTQMLPTAYAKHARKQHETNIEKDEPHITETLKAFEAGLHLTETLKAFEAGLHLTETFKAFEAGLLPNQC
jgi:hypothetical protein